MTEETPRIAIPVADVIENLDLLFGKGFITSVGRGRRRPSTSVLCYGPSGIGKTIFLLSFARRCACKGDTAVFVTFAHRAEVIRAQVDEFGWLTKDQAEGSGWEFHDLGAAKPEELESFLSRGTTKPRPGAILVWAIDEEEPGYDINSFRELCIETVRLVANRRDVRVIAIDGVNRLRLDGTGGSVPRPLPEQGPRETGGGCRILSVELAKLIALQEIGALLCMSAESPDPAGSESDRSHVLEEIGYQANVVFELGMDPGPSERRWIRLVKARAQKVVGGKHELKIDNNGMRVYPAPKTWREWRGWDRPSDGLPPTGSIPSVALFPRGDVYKEAGLSPITFEQKTLIRGPGGTGKRNLALRFIGHGPEGKQAWNGWALDFEWSREDIANKKYALQEAPDMAPTSSPAELFSQLAGAARDYLLNIWEPNGTCPRAVIADPHVLKFHGLAEEEIYQYVASLTGILSRLGYHVLVTDNVDIPSENEYFLDSIFENVYVTEMRQHRPSRRRFPWLHASRACGLARGSFQYFRLRPEPQDEAGFDIETVDTVAHADHEVIIPKLLVHLHQESDAQKQFITTIRTLLNEQALVPDLQLQVISFGPATAAAVRQGFISHRYTSHANACLVDSFDEDWAEELSSSDPPAFDVLWRDSGDREVLERYPDRSLQKVRAVTRTGESGYFGLPLILNVSVLAADLFFLRDGLKAVKAECKDSAKKDVLDKAVTEADMRAAFKSALSKMLKSATIDKRLSSFATDKLELIEWAWLARLALHAKLAQTKTDAERREYYDKHWPLFTIKSLRAETLVCFMLGYLFDQLVDLPGSPKAATPVCEGKYQWRRFRGTEPAGSERDELCRRLRDLHYLFCLAGWKEVTYAGPEDDAGNGAAGPKKAARAAQDGVLPRQPAGPGCSPALRYEWFATYRADFGEVRQTPKDSYYYLVKPGDIRFFSGDWYLGVREGSEAIGRGRELIEYLTSDDFLQDWIMRKGVGIPAVREVIGIRDHELGSDYAPSTLPTYRFDIPARQLWDNAMSRFWLMGYPQKRDRLKQVFREMIEIVRESAEKFAPLSGGQVLAPPRRDACDKRLGESKFKTKLDDRVEDLIRIISL